MPLGTNGQALGKKSNGCEIKSKYRNYHKEIPTPIPPLGTIRNNMNINSGKDLRHYFVHYPLLVLILQKLSLKKVK